MGRNSNKNLVLAYIAGFLDGDGAISALIEKHSEKKYGFRVRVSLDFYQHESNVEVLNYIRDFFGEGSLRKSINRTQKLSIRNQETLKRILPGLYKFSVIKKKQIAMAIKILNSVTKSRKGLISLAQRADSLAALNIRSKGIRKNTANMIINFPVET